MSITAGSAVTLEQLRWVERQLGEAAGRLMDARSRSRHLAEKTNWRTDAATAFHAKAESLRRSVAGLGEELEFTRDEIRRVRVRVEAEAWGHGG